MKREARRRVLLGAAAVQALQALGVRAQPAAADRNQQILDRWREMAASAAAAESPERQAQRMRERRSLLDRGEAALARCDVDAALAAFERAAQMLHAADTEMSLVRTYMQAGDYRRAVSFGAHTAGAHRQVVAGAVLYGWLLAQGGQAAVAAQLLSTAAQAEAADPLLEEAQRLLATPAALPHGALLAPPVRLAPYAQGVVVPRGTRVAGSGVLVGNGRHALVSDEALRGARALWLRNGLGQTVVARREAVDPDLAKLGVALLRLDGALPTVKLAAPDSRDPFPGSPGSVVGYTPSADALPAWPRLHLGFHGMPDERGPRRFLGIDLPVASSGAPVFDAAGRWVGIVLPHADGRPRVAMRGALQAVLSALPEAPAASAVASAGQRAPVDEVYESALRLSLQLLVKA